MFVYIYIYSMHISIRPHLLPIPTIRRALCQSSPSPFFLILLLPFRYPPSSWFPLASFARSE